MRDMKVNGKKIIEMEEELFSIRMAIAMKANLRYIYSSLGTLLYLKKRKIVYFFFIVTFHASLSCFFFTITTQFIHFRTAGFMVPVQYFIQMAIDLKVSSRMMRELAEEHFSLQMERNTKVIATVSILKMAC